MDDPFAILGLPRRPCLDETAIRMAFQDRARSAHPDAPDGDSEKFAELNAAHAMVADTALRLQLLSGLDATGGMPFDAEFGFRVGSLLREIDAVVVKSTVARNPLERALVAKELAAARKALATLKWDLEAGFASAGEKLRELDTVWPDVESAALAALGAQFRFLQRWRAQMRERQLALSV